MVSPSRSSGAPAATARGTATTKPNSITHANVAGAPIRRLDAELQRVEVVHASAAPSPASTAVVSEPQQLCDQILRCLQVGPGEVEPPEGVDDGTELHRLASLLTQRESASVGLFHLGGGIALGRHQGWAKRGLKLQLPLRPLARVRERPDDVEASGQVRDRLDVGRALRRTLTGP